MEPSVVIAKAKEISNNGNLLGLRNSYRSIRQPDVSTLCAPRSPGQAPSSERLSGSRAFLRVGRTSAPEGDHDQG